MIGQKNLITHLYNTTGVENGGIESGKGKKHFQVRKLVLFRTALSFSLVVTMVLSFLLLGEVKAFFMPPDPPDVVVNAKSAVILDAESGERLFSKNPGKKFPPASTTKVMTAVLVLENLSADSEISPGKRVVRVEPTIIGLKPGVKYRVKDLLAAILIKSANDAAFVLAEAVAGTEEEFADMMNEKAREIGMMNTNFATASGLPTGRKDSQYTTAEDLSILMRYALKYEIIPELMSKKEMNISGSDGKKIYLKTHNKALFKYKDAPWGKTGYTREARRTFIGMDPEYPPHVVFGLLKSTNLWKDIMILKGKGLELYNESRRTFWMDLAGFIKAQRARGRREAAAAYKKM